MLRRRLFSSAALSATVAARHQSTGGSNKEGGGGFSFKNSINNQRLSSNKGSAAAAAAASASATPTTPAASAAPKAGANPQQQKERAPFLGMLNSLADRADADSGASSGSKGSSSSSTSAADDIDGDKKKSLIGNPINIFLKYRPSNFFKQRKTDLAADRKSRLVFRDESGGNLDKFSLFKDPFLFVKYARFGSEFAADSELERRLRYYKEHASREIMTSDGGKLMRGPPQLFPLKQVINLQTAGGISGGAVNNNVGIRGFISAAVANSPNMPAKAGAAAAKGAAAAANGNSTVEGIAAMNNGELAKNQNADEGAAAADESSIVEPYYPTVNPAHTLRLPRIPVSHLAQFIPNDALRAASQPQRPNGAYTRKYLAKDDIAKEERTATNSKSGDSAAASSSAVAFTAGGSSQHVFNGANFRRPAMLVISQLGVKIGSEANNAWVCSALKYLEPNSPFITLFESTCNVGNVYGRSMRDAKSVTRATEEHKLKETIIADQQRATARAAEEAGAMTDEIEDAAIDAKATSARIGQQKGSSTTSTSSVKSSSSSMPAPMKRPIDLYCLRSMDLNPYAFLDKMLVKRFAASMDGVGEQLLTAASASRPQSVTGPSPYLFGSAESVVANTFVGTHLLRNFFDEPFRLRNFVGTTVLLVDHHGRVRWVSAGKPDEHERALLPKLLKDLETEYLAALSGRKA